MDKKVILSADSTCDLGGDLQARYHVNYTPYHINLDEHLTKQQYRLLLDAAIRTGCNYFTFNIPNTLCKTCGHISKHRLDKCPRCGGRDLDYATRIIGYLKLVSRFAAERQAEALQGQKNTAQEPKDSASSAFF